MSSFKLYILTIVLLFLVIPYFADAAPGAKKSRQHLKPKKSSNNNKLKATYKKAPSQATAANRNAKMNLYHSRSWPSATTNSFYHSPSMPSMYLRSAPSTMYYPSMRWSSPYMSTPSMMSNYLRRSDDMPSLSSALPTANPMSSMMSLASGGQTPTIIDMSAFTGNGMMDAGNYPSQSLWSMPEMTGSSPMPGSKSKFNLFNSLSLNDDGGLFGGLFSNQFK